MTDLPGAVAMLVTTGLLFLLGRRLFGRVALAALPAAFFALMPLTVDAAGAGISSVLQLPLLAAWLLCVQRWEVMPSDGRTLAAGGALLAVAIYVSPSALVMMPLCLVLTVVTIAALHRVRIVDRPILLTIGAFAIVGAPLLAMPVLQPERFRSLVLSYGLYDANRFNVFQGIREMTSWTGLTARSEVYYDYFNPAFLFLSPDGLGASLAEPSVFLLPFAVLLPVGLHRIVVAERSAVAWLAIGALLAAPCAAALTAQPPTAARMLLAAPFAAIVAAYGAHHLLSNERRGVRMSGAALCIMIPMCFAVTAIMGFAAR